MIGQGFDSPLVHYINMTRKTCIHCGKRKNLGSFYKHSKNNDGLDTRCKKCSTKGNKIRLRLRKKAPEKSSCCECCGSDKHKLFLDHDRHSKKFRGWLCNSCNTSIGRLGDNIEGLVKALNYLLKSRYL